MINETDKANRYFWILEYITVDRLDPVTTVHSQVKKGSYRKKHGSRYDSNSEELGLFAMLSPSALDAEPAVFYSPIHQPSQEFASVDSGADSDNWRLRSNRGSHQRRYQRRSGSKMFSFRGSKHRSQSLHSLSSRSSNSAAFFPSWNSRELERWNSAQTGEGRVEGAM